MMPTTRFKKLYSYEKIYNKVYIVRLNNRKIIRVRDVRFYKEDVPGRSVEEEVLFKTVFNEKAEEFTFGTVRFKTTFGSSESPILQIPMISRFQETEAQVKPPIDKPTAKKRII